MYPSSILISLLLLLLPFGSTNPVSAGLELTRFSNEASDWIAEEEDHICGLSALRALSVPAKVDYPELWDATPEIKRMKRDGIDPDSAAGIRLQQEATDRILLGCKEIRRDRDHCSVWKAISHRDGRDIPDITERVKALFPK